MFRSADCAKFGLAALLIMLNAGMADAQSYPSHVVRIIVPFAAGGLNDTAARLIQPYLEKALGQTVVVENRAGATTVNAGVPAKTLGEFIALAKANPGKLNYATPGAASQTRFVVELWSGRAGIKMQHIPYRGGAPAVASVIAGQTEFSALSSLVTLPHIQAGSLRALAVGSLTRYPQLPDVPTVAESGFPDFEAVQWVGLLTTAGTPRNVVDRLNAEVSKAVRNPELIAKLAQEGMLPGGGTSAEFRGTIAAEIKSWKETARAANIQPE